MKGRWRRCIFYITYKQEDLIESILVGHTDVTRAYIEAGYANKMNNRG